MKQIVFLTRLFSPHVGGVETHVLQISKRLINSGYTVTVITEQFEEQLPLKEEKDHLQVIRIPQSQLTKLGIWSWILQHRELFTQANVVHVHDVFWWVIPIYGLVKDRIYITFHGWEGVFPPRRTAVWHRRLAARLSRGVIQIGDFIQKWYGTQPDIVSYGATDQQLTSKKSINKYHLAFIGRLSPDNDLPEVINLIETAKASDSQIKVIFIGDGELAELASRYGQVTGFVKDVEKYLSESEVVVANSYLSILQAMALRKLVCSIYTNPLKKDYMTLHPQAGNMIVGNSGNAIWQQLLQLDRSQRKLMIKQSQAWAKDQSWEQLTDKYKLLWRK